MLPDARIPSGVRLGARPLSKTADKNLDCALVENALVFVGKLDLNEDNSHQILHVLVKPRLATALLAHGNFNAVPIFFQVKAVDGSILKTDSGGIFSVKS